MATSLLYDDDFEEIDLDLDIRPPRPTRPFPYEVPRFAWDLETSSFDEYLHGPLLTPIQEFTEEPGSDVSDSCSAKSKISDVSKVEKVEVTVVTKFDPGSIKESPRSPVLEEEKVNSPKTKDETEILEEEEEGSSPKTKNKKMKWLRKKIRNIFKFFTWGKCCRC